MQHFKPDEIIVLLGAGASVDAGIPNSPQMIENVEALIDGDWAEFRDLYHYIRSSIQYAHGIAGRFGDQVHYNIEVLVNTLDELRKKKSHPLFPFVGNWNPVLIEVAGPGFEKIEDFRKKIVQELQQWIALDRYGDADYYRGLVRFQQQYEHPLRVFTLNYDLCVERACAGASVELGFDSGRIWDWRRFEHNPNDPKDLFLYKLHGSADWKRDPDRNLTWVDSPQKIHPDDVAIIFGTAYKLQYVDPFLFFAYELRRRTLDDARLIVSIGYGFGDEHINGILQQAINAKPDCRLLSVAPVHRDPCTLDQRTKAEAQEKERIESVLDLARQDQVVAWSYRAREFMADHLDLAHMDEELFPEKDEELFEEVRVESEAGFRKATGL